jgi:hypothetical protein
VRTDRLVCEIHSFFSFLLSHLSDIFLSRFSPLKARQVFGWAGGVNGFAATLVPPYPIRPFFSTREPSLVPLLLAASHFSPCR